MIHNTPRATLGDNTLNSFDSCLILFLFFSKGCRFGEGREEGAMLAAVQGHADFVLRGVVCLVFEEVFEEDSKKVHVAPTLTQQHL